MRAWLHSSGRWPTTGVAIALLAGVLVYANAFRGVFQFDDYNVIVDNPHVHSWSAWWADAGQGIRPLLKLSYTLDWMLGLGPLGFHLTNLLTHLLNIWLVWALARRFVAAQPQLQAQARLPLLVALLFAVHPVHSEAITYISGRSSALMALFYLAGLLAYVEGRARQSQWLLHGVAPLAMLSALAVKETAVTFPLALLLWEVYGGGNLKSALRTQWSSWLLLPAVALFFLGHAGYQSEMATSADLNSLQGNLATQAMAFGYLLRQWLLPLWLNIDPDLHVLQGVAQAWLPLLLVLACLVLALVWRKHRPWLGFALAWALLHLLPLYLLLPRVDVANERQLYLVGWPLALALLAELSLWLRPRTFTVAAGGLLVLLGCLTVLRNADYRSEVALWQATARYSPDKARVHNNLGYAYMQAGRTEDARRQFIIALRLDPQYYKARFNLLNMGSSND
ncbi:MAG TPA: tetratricopeptide repeat protein [Gallionellaceae bacterium]|nr:tetratricopeptide repeat protein [Gallionellaceae bacterium]